MVGTARRKLSSKLVGLALIAGGPLLLSQCGKLPGGMPKGVPDVPSGDCPANVADVSAIESADFGLSAELNAKVKNALSAGATVQALSVDIEGQVAEACANLAKDLGADEAALKPKEDGPGKKAEAACDVAVKLIGEVKAKAKAKITVDVKPPKCEASMNAAMDCAAKCDATVKPGSAKVTCEGGEISGKCDAKCEGKCTVEGSASCDGSCSGECKGECSAEISGKCDGTCDGTCDGKNTKGKCTGQCQGKCKGKAEAQCSGSCKGSCSASCEMTAKGECKGECSGKCTAEFKEPKCSGEVKPPQMSADCKAKCDGEISAKAECKPAKIFVKIEGAADFEAANKLKAAFEKNLPTLLKISMGMKGKLEGVEASAKAGLEEVAGTVKGAGVGALKVASCFASSLDAQAKASVSLKVSVKASASASGSAAGSAG
jgi:hypothetical protein